MLIERLKLKNLLSFGPEGIDIKLGKLNVLIGPNGSGKSNLIEAIGLLKAMPRDIGAAILEGGGVREWIWLGDEKRYAVATIETVVNYVDIELLKPLRHRIELAKVGEQFDVRDELIESVSAAPGEHGARSYYARRTLRAKGPGGKPYGRTEELDSRQSVLAQIKDPGQFSQITSLGNAYSQIGIYRDWTFGPDARCRYPQKTDLPDDRLQPDAGNLVMVLNRLRATGKDVKRRLRECVQEFVEGAQDFDIRIQGGTAQLFLEDRSLPSPVPATRLSDGTLRYLSLLAILLDPDPPALVCIDEPELGLHPDLVVSVGKLLIEASSRMQLIVTTHSDMLVDLMSKQPEDVIVCERHEGETKLRRAADEAALKEWLKSYSLGQLWHSGDIGGNRW
ncbi:MAG TPA: AAA family ATPase [Tepidisphaeraceae bacterium]|nr:AAA family ATPase [Tepidisphaeraceae bacterium]